MEKTEQGLAGKDVSSELHAVFENIEALSVLSFELRSYFVAELRRVSAHDGTLDDIDQKQLEKRLRDISALVKLFMSEEKSIHALQQQRAGKAGDYAFDLGKARSEICERLDRIRAARGD